MSVLWFFSLLSALVTSEDEVFHVPVGPLPLRVGATEKLRERQERAVDEVLLQIPPVSIDRLEAPDGAVVAVLVPGEMLISVLSRGLALGCHDETRSEGVHR